MEAAVDYLKFAFGKAENHRGLSASRSVDRIGEYLWLLGLDTDAFEAAEYAQYGVPKLKVAADRLGVPFPESPRLVNMRCTPAHATGRVGRVADQWTEAPEAGRVPHVHPASGPAGGGRRLVPRARFERATARVRTWCSSS